MSEIGLTDKDIEEWLYNRLGPGNVFEQFNRDFCKDLARAAVKKVVEWLLGYQEYRDDSRIEFLIPIEKWHSILKAAGKEERRNR